MQRTTTPFPQQKPSTAAKPQKRKADDALVKPAPAAPAAAAAAASSHRPPALLRPAKPQPQIQSTIKQSTATPFAAAPGRISVAPVARKPPQLLQPRPAQPAARKIIAVPRAQPAAAAAASGAHRPQQALVQPKPATLANRAVPAIRPPAPPPPPARPPEPRADAPVTRARSKKKDQRVKQQRHDINEADLPFEQSQKHAPKAKQAKADKRSKRFVLDLTDEKEATEEDEAEAEAEAEAQANRDRPPLTLTEWLESSPRPSPEPTPSSQLPDPIRTFGHRDVLSVVVILGDERDALEAELHARAGTHTFELDDDGPSQLLQPADSLFPWVLRLLHRTHGLTWSCLCGALPLHCSWLQLRSHIRRVHGGVDEPGEEINMSPSTTPPEDGDEDSEMHTPLSGDDAASVAASSTTHQLVTLPSNLRALPPRDPSLVNSGFPSSTWPPTRRRTRG